MLIKLKSILFNKYAFSLAIQVAGWLLIYLLLLALAYKELKTGNSHASQLSTTFGMIMEDAIGLLVLSGFIIPLASLFISGNVFNINKVRSIVALFLWNVFVTLIIFILFIVATFDFSLI